MSNNNNPRPSTGIALWLVVLIALCIGIIVCGWIGSAAFMWLTRTWIW